MPPTSEQVVAGQAVYTKRMLSAYDIIVLVLSNRHIWKCPSSKILAHYNRHVSGNHLDVGVGTGYFLDRCSFPSSPPRIALMDLNSNTLAFASQRISRWNPETYQQNIFEPIEPTMAPFDSVGINYLLHCLPGSMEEKTVAFDKLKLVMKPGARIFGSTILQGGVTKSWMANWLMAFYNKKGIFSNIEDNLEGLHRELCQRFVNITVEVVGCVALFSGQIH